MHFVEILKDGKEMTLFENDGVEYELVKVYIGYREIEYGNTTGTLTEIAKLASKIHLEDGLTSSNTIACVKRISKEALEDQQDIQQLVKEAESFKQAW